MKVNDNKSDNRIVQTRFLELLARKKRIEARDITYQTVVDETGISMSSIQKWANNKLTRFDAAQILAFTRYFGCSLGELLVIEDFSDEDESEGQIKETLAA